MNKTIDINLANILFHIDENAYNKLRQYLEAIRRSFSGTPGCEEIIADVEARIAELFSEKLENERQVISMKEVEEVITVMGQPEDYMVDEDIFEDVPPRRTAPGRTKKLYRDPDHKYIGGVCAGLEHYLAVDALWIRLLFLLMTFLSGFGIVAYLILWILVPEATSTAQKLDMRGEPVNLSNIERKVKEGFDEVADRVKNVDYEKVGDRVKRSSRTFFDAVADIFLFLFRVVGKLIGIFLILLGSVVLIGLFIGLFTVGVMDIIHIPGIDFYELALSRAVPIWVISLLSFLAIGIPFFFLMYLGLKILVNNLKSIGRVAKFSLLGAWLIAVIGLIVIGINQATAHAFSGRSTETKVLSFPTPPDTLLVKFRDRDYYDANDHVFQGFDGMEVIYSEDGSAMIYSDRVRLDLESAQDSLFTLDIRRSADGSSFESARERASKISYNYETADGTLYLDGFLTASTEDKMRDQQVRLLLHLPPGTLLRFDAKARNLGYRTDFEGDHYRSEVIRHTWRMEADNKLICLDCADLQESTEDLDANPTEIENEWQPANTEEPDSTE